MPPASVSGRLASRPTTAAAVADTTSSAMEIGSRLAATSGATRMPASAATPQLMAHAIALTRLESMPISPARSTRSTTARIWTPSLL